MGFISIAKAFAIRASDKLNELHDYRAPFTRQAMPKENKKLWEIEKEFFEDLVNNFWICDGQVLASRLPLPIGSPVDTGDQALWHGIYTGMLALRWRWQRDPATYGHLIEAVKGLRLHQNAHGEPVPRLIRGVSDDLKTWEDDASNDSATGHLFGIFATWKWGPEALRPVCEVLARGLAAELLAHQCSLVNADGRATTYGALDQGWKTDPLRISLAMAIYAVGATLCKEPAFIQAYEDLWRKYKALAPYPKVKLWWLDNHNDAHRAAIHLAILSDLTSGEVRLEYVKGLGRIRRMVDADGNIWVNALCDFGGYGWGPDNRDDAMKVLSEFTLKDKQFNEGRDGRKSPLLKACGGETVWNGKWVSRQPLPRWATRAQDFVWQRNLHSLDAGSDGASADSRLNGGDFLAAYWLSRLTGILSANN